MKQDMPFVVTISRQLGSGGAYIGRQLANKLNIFYADREIIRGAAKQLSGFEENLELRDEKVQSFWESFMQFSPVCSDIYIPPQALPVTDRELYEAETEVIANIVKKQSAVIIGRCGSHIFREYPEHISIFLHADIPFRSARVQKLYRISKDEAGKMIGQSDKDRGVYCKTFTGKDWTDARKYDLSVNTGKTGVEKASGFILDYIKERLK